MAILYNYFTFDGTTVRIRKGNVNNIKSFVSDKDKFSLEHFIINNGTGFTLQSNNAHYTYSNDIKKYSNSIFNYIFIPDALNGNLLKDYYITDKITILKPYLGQIECNYSKMVIDNIFDARIIELEKEEVYQYFKARQAFAIDKFLTQLKGEKKIDYRLHTSSTIIEALAAKKVLYQDISNDYKYGLMYSISREECFEFDGNEEKFMKCCFNA